MSNNEIFVNKMKTLAKNNKLVFDGGKDETRLFLEQSNSVFVLPMSKDSYEAMCKDLESYKIQGEGYLVYAWNDVSSYEYWSERGKDGECNYIQVTIDIENIDIIDPIKMKKDISKLEDHFEKYHNKNAYVDYLNDPKGYVSKILAKKKSNK